MTATLSPAETAHARSILEPATVEPVPEKKTLKILIGSVIRKPPEVVRAFLETLEWQQLHTNVELHYFFILDTLGEPYHQEVLDLLQRSALADRMVMNEEHQPLIVQPSEGYDAYQHHTGTTRGWQPAAWHRIGAIKNEILQHTLAHKFDFVWLVDADVMCDPRTLQSLLDSANAQAYLMNAQTVLPIVSGVYWTFWTKRSDHDQFHQHAGPQVWLRHPYFLDGQGWSEATFRAALTERQRVRVWGLGACTLIPAQAIAKGVNFSKVGDLPPGPMSDGEDRHFCRRADNLHIQLIADAWPDIYHAYHPDEYADLPQHLQGLRAARKTRALLGDLVSLRLTNLDAGTPPTWKRGRLGVLGLLPELEHTIGQLAVGEKALTKVHFPAHWPRADLRGKNCVMEVALLDAKPFQLPPVLRRELLLAHDAIHPIDATTLTHEQLAEVLDA